MINIDKIYYFIKGYIKSFSFDRKDVSLIRNLKRIKGITEIIFIVLVMRTVIEKKGYMIAFTLFLLLLIIDSFLFYKTNGEWRKEYYSEKGERTYENNT